MCERNWNRRKKLLVKEKNKKPRGFQQIVLQKLPLKYYASNNSWMALGIFIEQYLQQFLQHWDRKLNKTKKSICLVLDNCTALPNVFLKNTTLEFSPPDKPH